VNKELIPRYEALCLTVLVSNNEVTDAIQAASFRKSMVEKIRAERMTFVDESFPFALKHVIHLTMKAKLQRITKNNKRKLDALISEKKCTSMVCQGKVHPQTQICTLCDRKYCRDCDMVMKEDHVCKDEDKESKQIVDSLVKCPTCHIPAIRSFGCDAITCAVCHTHFHYITGKKINSGNHHNVVVTLREDRHMASLLQHQDLSENVITQLSQVHEMAPKSYSRSDLIAAIKSNNTRTARLYESEVLHMTYRKLYTQCMQSIWDTFESTKNLELEKMIEIVKVLKQKHH